MTHLLRLLRFRIGIACIAFWTVDVPAHAQPKWQPADGPLMTRWAKDVSPENALPEYPRPQLVRERWQNLNGLWQFAIQQRDAGRPDSFDGEILVPFPVESALSGVMQRVGPDNRLWYRRTFEVPAGWRGQRVILHFGAVDWDAVVSVNGREVGRHRGGYDPFHFDITDALQDGNQQDLVVSVWDPSDKGVQPRGKQVVEPRGIWYTPVTGIWQTVWLEPVPTVHVERLLLVPDVDAGALRVTVVPSRQADGQTVQCVVRSGGEQVASGDGVTGREITIKIPDATPWSPERPHLYDLQIGLSSDGGAGDTVESYFGLRKIEVRKDVAGVNRLFLNNEPLFQFGPLDQGWWPDGLYAAPTDAALRYDIEITKQLGFNMARKHVKVEPARWYYWCDKLGLLVWQDMPNGDRHIRPDQPDIERSPESEAIYRREWQAIIEARRNHPSIVAWVPFNEGWGQFQTDEILDWTKTLDPSRLVDGPSGWADRGSGDMHDMHRYPGPAMPPLEGGRASVLGEFGGLGLPLEGHTWLDKGNWGYRTYTSREDLAAAYHRLIVGLHALVGEGLAAAIYTQTTDVEIEVNGLMTYDRALIKLPEEIAKLHQRLYGPPPKIAVVVPTSREKPQTWRYTTDKPADDWTQPDFDASSWNEGPGGFGTQGTPGAVVRTEWSSSDIWLRRELTLEGGRGADLSELCLRIHHDENAEVYLNGRLVAKTEGYTTDYTLFPLEEQARTFVQPGANTLAVHCRQTGGGQYIDVGIVELVPAERANDQRPDRREGARKAQSGSQ